MAALIGDAVDRVFQDARLGGGEAGSQLVTHNYVVVESSPSSTAGSVSPPSVT